MKTEAPAGFRFPEGFLWGASCASHQVEGNNYSNDWWEYEQAGRVPHRSEAACDHFRSYANDFDLARSLGHNAHRLSLEWSRIEPAEGRFDAEAIAHYKRVIAALRQRDIEPIVTLHHFTNPAWFAQRGGWERPDSVDLFRRYVAHVAPHFAESVKYWLTINEPTVFVKRGYVAGSWPPCRKGAWLAGLRALRNLCRAHTAAYEVLHRERQGCLVGFAHSAPYVAPCRPGHLTDRLAARFRNFVLNDCCFLLFGRAPTKVLDFIGLNYYARELVRWRPSGMALLFGAECRANHHGRPRHFSSLGWEVYPTGLQRVLTRFARFGVPLLITENGIATANEDERTAYLASHVRSVAAAIAGGIDVRGYLYWTLFDNFEWAEGFNAKFGLASSERATTHREPRPAARLYAIICRTNSCETTLRE
jgi:beta-glucosidase